MKNRVLSVILTLLFVLGTVSGYGNSNNLLSSRAENLTVKNYNFKNNPVNSKDTNISEVDINNDFNNSLISFIEKTSFKDKNYTISPTSFRAAMALAISGADKETKSELLNAMGFHDVNELNSWYMNVISSIDSFDDRLQINMKKNFEIHFFDNGAKATHGAFNLQNSIWRNTNSSGTLSKKYIKYVKDNYNATAKVNLWINKNTNGLITSISDDLSNTDLILVNTLYLKTSWENEFPEYGTKEANFKTLSGKTVKKDFMQQKGEFRYYEDEKGKFVVLPMKGGINTIFILGDVDAIDNLSKASYEDVYLKLPKFSFETAFSNNELMNFCKACGAKQAFTKGADFSLMSDDDNLYITDIIQKTKIEVYESGIEVAAATDVSMALTGMVEFKEFKEFIADEPFRYMIITDSEEPELL